MSKMMLLNEIKKEVDKFVKRNYRGDDKFLLQLISGLKFAYKNNLLSLKPWIMNHICSKMEEIPNDAECSDSFKTLRIEMIVDLFGKAVGWRHPTTMEKLKVFMVWLSANEATSEQKNGILDSFNFEDVPVEELMTTIRESGLYPAQKIDEMVLELVNNKD